MTTVLSFDTSAPHCVVTLSTDGELRASHHTTMARGQAENLFPVIHDVLARAQVSLNALDGIAVGIGPGNFTGIRIAVSAARGLALGLKLPSVGISTFEVAHYLAQNPDVIYLAAPRGTLYAQRFDKEKPKGAPWIEEATAEGTCRFHPHEISWEDGGLAALAHLGSQKLQAGDHQARPAPLYVRPADAAPARDTPPRILT